MANHPRNGHRDTRRTLTRAARRAVRRGSPDAAWLSAIAAGMTGARY